MFLNHNQKYFLFDADYKVLKREKVTLLKIEDENGDSAENIQGIVAWMKQSFENLLESKDFQIAGKNQGRIFPRIWDF